MRALYLKELRSLWPFLILTGLLLSGDLLFRPFTERLDEQTWEGIASYLRPGQDGTFGWILGILSVCVAYAAFPREHDERTIHFLYALPIRRPWIFVTKAAAGLTILWAGVGLLLVSDAAQSVWNSQSFEGAHWRADVALSHAVLQATFCAIVYAHGLAASVLRRFGVLPYALLLFVAWIVRDVLPPAAWIDPSALLVARYEGARLSIAWGPWIVHALVGVVAALTAYAAWMGPAEAIGLGLRRTQASLAGKLALGCGGAGLVVVSFALVGIVTQIGPPDAASAEAPAPAERPSRASQNHRTARYELTYPVSHEARALALAADADAIHAAIQRELGAEPGPLLAADLTEESAEHRGIASWTHLRIGLAAEPDPIRLRHVFAHETAHAFQHTISDQRQSDAGDATRFFAEGGAEHLADRVVPNEAARRAARAVAAATWARHGMRSDDLLDERRLRERFDTTLVYSLGERWVDALSRVCGAGAVGDALRAMAREGAPRDLGPRAFWEDTLAAFGCDLEAVDAAFAAQLADDALALADAIEPLPRMSGGVVGRDGGVLLVAARLDRDVPASALFFVRVRATVDAEDTRTFSFRGRLDPADPRRVAFRLTRAVLPSTRFQLQLCALVDERGWPFCETWRWATDR
ncbi:MAG: hypothetical protein KF729_18030 [Sandaracinaceae bacterium]|nr:hypothetical protein [Sandaracinaceae bacterium]